MGKYTFLLLGIILGIAIALYVYAIKKERYAKRIKNDQENFSTQRLDNALERAVHEMQSQMKELGRKLTEDEKNQIIFGHLKESENIKQ
ncbi:MAG: hypothetical protein J6A89_05000 [Clostridia bacterium]|nr:hypothetical protein [Clostridia bacterium]